MTFTDYILLALPALFVGAFLGLVIAALLNANRDDDDTKRVSFFEIEQSCLLYNPEQKAWGVVDKEGGTQSVGASAREAIDRAIAKGVRL